MTKTNRILLAMRAGAKTSSKIAHSVRLNRANISVALCELADLRIIKRAGVVNTGAPGRPYARWRPISPSPKGSSQIRS